MLENSFSLFVMGRTPRYFLGIGEYRRVSCVLNILKTYFFKKLHNPTRGITGERKPGRIKRKRSSHCVRQILWSMIHDSSTGESANITNLVLIAISSVKISNSLRNPITH